MYETFPKKGGTSKVDVGAGNDGRVIVTDMDSACPPLGGGPDGYMRISAKTYRKTTLPDQGTNETDYENLPGGVHINGTRQPTSTKEEKGEMGYGGMMPSTRNY